ncbi:MAG: hypothetical protein ACLUI3_17460 [Christensenellales bacterium]
MADKVLPALERGIDVKIERPKRMNDEKALVIVSFGTTYERGGGH